MKPDQLVDEAFRLQAEISLLSLQLAAVRQQLIALGAGEYSSAAGKALVIFPRAAINPSPDTIAAQRERIEAPAFQKLFERQLTHRLAEGAVEFAREKLKPDVFKRIFQVVTTFRPVKSFRDVAAAVLSKKRAAVLVNACEAPAEPYVKLSAAPAKP